MNHNRIVTWDIPSIGTVSSIGTASRAFLFGGYGDNYKKYRELVEKAKADFPELDLKDEAITLSKVHGSDYMDRYICISFSVPPGTKREGYADWGRFDFFY